MGSGSLVRVIPLLHAVIGFHAALSFPHESPKGMVSYAVPNQSPNVFLSVRQRVTRASG